MCKALETFESLSRISDSETIPGLLLHSRYDVSRCFGADLFVLSIQPRTEYMKRNASRAHPLHPRPVPEASEEYKGD